MSADAPVLRLAPIADADSIAVETLLDAAFGHDRHLRTAYRLRAGTVALPGLSFALFEESRLIATIQCWPIALTPPTGTAIPLVLVGPVAVHPGRQQAGLGRTLMETMLDAASRLGRDALVLIGDPEYYTRFFAFEAAPTEAWNLPGPVERHRLLARLAPGRTLPAIGTLGPNPSHAG